jgi:GTP cyclohydrolase I
MTGEHLQSRDDQSFDHEKARRGTRLLLEAMGRDPDEGALAESWERRVPDTLETLSEGYRDDAKPTMRTFDAGAPATELVIKTGIPVYSLCEHHLLPYTGTAQIGYHPGDEVVGLSKLTRYVRWQARRLTVQEQLTTDIATGLAEEIGAEGVVVVISATHLCEAMRGAETETETRTTATAGTVSDEGRRRALDAATRPTKTV